MNVLVTGNMGYVGPIVVRHLRQVFPGSKIMGVDSAYFGGCLATDGSWPERCLDTQIYADVREPDARWFEGVDAVVMLAAVSNDPMGARFASVTDEINHRACVKIAEVAVKAGVKRLVFASSCSVYGAAGATRRSETDEVAPITAYAISKVATERALEAMMAEAWVPRDVVVTALRFATACGMSPRLRLDLVMNDFVVNSLRTGKLTLLSDGSAWRPLIEVRDMARAIEWAMIRAAEDSTQYLAINAGSHQMNVQVRDLAVAVAEQIPGTEIQFAPSAGPDKRSYQVDFSLYQRLAPLHQPQISLGLAIRGVVDGFGRLVSSGRVPSASDLIRLRVLENHISSGILSEDLRWV